IWRGGRAVEGSGLENLRHSPIKSINRLLSKQYHAAIFRMQRPVPAFPHSRSAQKRHSYRRLSPARLRVALGHSSACFLLKVIPHISIISA
ncbi:hypothetical protein, partial [Komagataeibacter europaeus]|uniref:hypothetical protein n=1 Tax=Komagataeibacter europaeus TaxID=33995 RepID=UPI00195527DE